MFFFGGVACMTLQFSFMSVGGRQSPVEIIPLRFECKVGGNKVSFQQKANQLDHFRLQGKTCWSLTRKNKFTDLVCTFQGSSQKVSLSVFQQMRFLSIYFFLSTCTYRLLPFYLKKENDEKKIPREMILFGETDLPYRPLR